MKRGVLHFAECLCESGSFLRAGARGGWNTCINQESKLNNMITLRTACNFAHDSQSKKVYNPAGMSKITL
jgi:hypothetical protein